MFKIDKQDSTLRNYYGHKTKKDDICSNWCLHLEDSSNVQTRTGMLHHLMDHRGEYLEKYRCLGGCRKLNTSTKAIYATQLCEALIIKLTTFDKYISSISNRVIPNLSID